MEERWYFIFKGYLHLPVQTSYSVVLYIMLESGCNITDIQACFCVTWKPTIKLQQPLMLSLKCMDTETWDSFRIYQSYLSHISVLSVYLHFSRAICSCSVWAHYDNTSFTHSDGGDTIHKLRSAQFEIKINFIAPAWIFVLCTEGAPRTRKGTNQSYNQQSRLFQKPCSELNNWLSVEGGKEVIRIIFSESLTGQLTNPNQ